MMKEPPRNYIDIKAEESEDVTTKITQWGAIK
jgi:hypothetical protein